MDVDFEEAVSILSSLISEQWALKLFWLRDSDSTKDPRKTDLDELREYIAAEMLKNFSVEDRYEFVRKVKRRSFSDCIKIAPAESMPSVVVSDINVRLDGLIAATFLVLLSNFGNILLEATRCRPLSP
jgi:hypothetical protein